VEDIIYTVAMNKLSQSSKLGRVELEKANVVRPVTSSDLVLSTLGTRHNKSSINHRGKDMLTDTGH